MWTAAAAAVAHARGACPLRRRARALRLPRRGLHLRLCLDPDSHPPARPPRPPQGTADGFGGEFVVPSYRGATFLDPKGRGAATGYDTAVALPAAGDDGALLLPGCASALPSRLRVPVHPPPGQPLSTPFLHPPPGQPLSTPFLPHAAEEYLKENIKSAGALKGQAVFSIAKVDAATGEIAGVFESVQPSDTDLGAKAPKDVKITGLWYAQLS